MKAAFDIDHFLPVAVHPQHQGSYDNLLYACAACNQTKRAAILPDPTMALLEGTVQLHTDGRLESKTPEAERIISQLGLDTEEETEARLLWNEIIALAERHDSALHARLMGFPEDLPDLARSRPPGGNSRPDGVVSSWFARRRDGTLPEAY